MAEIFGTHPEDKFYESQLDDYLDDEKGLDDLHQYDYRYEYDDEECLEGYKQ